MAVYCPICEREINWDAAEPHRYAEADATYQRVEPGPGENEDAWNSRLTTFYRPCGDATDPSTHFLPWDYADHVPVTIGMIGDTSAGKTALLAAMIFRLFASPDLLRSVGIESVSALDRRAHQQYLLENVTPLIQQRRELGGTRTAVVGFCDAIKVTNSRGQTFAITFFDLAGEDLARPKDTVLFYARAQALIFVIDAERLALQKGKPSLGDASFEIALHRLSRRPKPREATLLPVTAAVVVAKSDLIEFDDVTPGDWLARGSPREESELSTVERETEEAYIYLSTRLGASSWLRPVRECDRSTLHFASATNSTAVKQYYPGSFRQRRVLKPLLTVFAQLGIIDPGLLAPTAGERP